MCAVGLEPWKVRPVGEGASKPAWEQETAAGCMHAETWEEGWDPQLWLRIVVLSGSLVDLGHRYFLTKLRQQQE